MAYYNQLLYEAGGGIISPNQRSKRENGASIFSDYYQESEWAFEE